MIRDLNISKDLLIKEVDVTIPTISNVWLNLLHNGSILIISLIFLALHRALYRTFSRLGARYINEIVVPSLVYMYIFVPVELSVKILRTLYYPLTDLIGNELCYIITWTEIHATMYAQMHTFFVTCFRYVCLFHENIFFPLTPRSFGRIILVISFFVPLIITYGVVNATDHLVTLDACLGHYEQTYVKTSGNQLCNSGSYFDTGFCKVVFVLYAIISSHIPEAILLYRCFRMIQIQTELSHDLIGDKQYIQRRRDNGIVISVSGMQWFMEVCFLIIYLIFTLNFHGWWHVTDKFFGIFIAVFSGIVQPAFYLTGDRTFRSNIMNHGFVHALKMAIFNN